MKLSVVRHQEPVLHFLSFGFLWPGAKVENFWYVMKSVNRCVCVLILHMERKDPKE